MLYRVHKGDKTIKYVKDSRDIQKYLPNDETIQSVKNTSNGRKLLYDKTGWYHIQNTSKQIGYLEGDVCSICNSGELINMGGCFTCNSCGAQLKCGL